MSKVSKGPEGAKKSSDFEGSLADAEALRALGLNALFAPPTPATAVPDLLMYGLVSYLGAHPVHGIVQGVASELDALAMFIEGPLSITLEMMARRLRTAVDLAKRLREQEPSEDA